MGPDHQTKASCGRCHETEQVPSWLIVYGKAQNFWGSSQRGPARLWLSKSRIPPKQIYNILRFVLWFPLKPALKQVPPKKQTLHTHTHTHRPTNGPGGLPHPPRLPRCFLRGLRPPHGVFDAPRIQLLADWSDSWREPEHQTTCWLRWVGNECAGAQGNERAIGRE